MGCVVVTQFCIILWRQYSYFYFLFFCFLGLHLQHMEVPRLGVRLELQLPVYTTATATPDLNGICDLHHSSHQCQNLNPVSEARDQICILMDTSLARYCWATTGTSLDAYFQWELTEGKKKKQNVFEYLVFDTPESWPLEGASAVTMALWLKISSRGHWMPLNISNAHSLSFWCDVPQSILLSFLPEFICICSHSKFSI